jgi:dihydrofolate reductase
MSATVDGFIADRDGNFAWTVPSDELFAFQVDFVASLGAVILGRRLYETMQVWETDASLRGTEAGAAFADFWSALPKVVFSRTLQRVDGNARLATASLNEEIAAATAQTSNDIEIGGATLAAEAIRLDRVDELRILRNPIIVGGGTPLLPPVDHDLKLALVETRAFGSIATFERYRRVR